MKKYLIIFLILLCAVAYAADQVILVDKTGKEVDPGASNRWPVVHLNAGTAGVKMLLSAPGNTKSHYITGFIMTGGADADGFHFLRQNCLRFTAANNTLSLADSASYDWGTLAAVGDFRAEFWMNLEATTAAVPSLMKRGDETNNGWLIELTTASLVKFTMHDGANGATITATTAIDDGEWHFISVVCDRSSTTGLQIYVDGAADATAVDPTAVTLTIDGGTTIVMTGVASEVFYISAVGIYIGSTTPLTAANILASYNSGIGLKYEGDETALVAGFNTDEGVGTSCHDIKNDAAKVGTITNTSWAPSRQNGATAEVNVDGVPINEQDMTVAVGKFHCGVGAAFGGVPIIFPHPIKIGRNCPLSILETNGGFGLIVFGYTTIAR